MDEKEGKGQKRRQNNSEFQLTEAIYTIRIIIMQSEKETQN